MQVCSSQSISYTHIGIPWLYIFLPSRRSKIWNKTVHSFHSLEENIGDICDDLQKMCFVVVFLKKILLKSWQIFNVLDWTDWQFKRSKANITLPKDQLKIVLCVCVLLAANVLAGKNCCYLAPAKNFFFQLFQLRCQGVWALLRFERNKQLFTRKAQFFTQ